MFVVFSLLTLARDLEKYCNRNIIVSEVIYALKQSEVIIHITSDKIILCYLLSAACEPWCVGHCAPHQVWLSYLIKFNPL